jgi:hypothetical protein
LNDIIEDPHHGYGLLLAEALGLEALDELQGIKVVIAGTSWCRMECATSWIKGCDIDAIMADRVCVGGLRFG